MKCVRFIFFTWWRKQESLRNFQAPFAGHTEHRRAFRGIRAHRESPKRLTGLEPDRADGQRATAVQRDIFLVLAHVHSQHDLFDAAGVIIENKLGAFAFEALSPGRHGGW